MDQLLLKLADLGIVGIVAAILLYDVFFLQKKIIQIIENNTKAMSELQSYCSSRVERHRHDDQRHKDRRTGEVS